MSTAAAQCVQCSQSNKPTVRVMPPFAMRGRPALGEFANLHFPDNGYLSGHVSIIGKDWRRVHYERSGKPLENYFRFNFMMRKQEYYITPNSFQGGTHDAAHLFGYNNVYFDFDIPKLHKNPRVLSDTEARNHEHLFNMLCAMIDTDYPAGLPKPNTVVYTGRGFGFWWAVNQTSYKMKALFEALVNELYARFSKWLMDEGVTQIEGDPCASKRPAGLARLPGSYNPKVKRWGYFRILHHNRLDLRTTATELGIGFVDDSGRYSPMQTVAGDTDFPPAAASARLEMLRGLIRLRAENDTLRGCRDLILYTACNSLQQIYSDPDLVMNEVFQLNDLFGADAFRVGTVRTFMSSSLRKYYAITDYKTKELLDITDEEMRLLNWSPDWSAERLGTENLHLLKSDRGKELPSPEKETTDWANAAAVSTDGMSVRMAQKVKRVVKEKRTAAVKAWLASGENPDKIAEKFHISRATVYRIAKVEEPTAIAALCAAQNEEKPKQKEHKIGLTLRGAAKTIYYKLFWPIYEPIRNQREALNREDYQNRLKGDPLTNKDENNMNNTTPDSNYECNTVSKVNSDNIYSYSSNATDAGSEQLIQDHVGDTADIARDAGCPNPAHQTCPVPLSDPVLSDSENSCRTCAADFPAQDNDDSQDYPCYGIEHSSDSTARPCRRRHPEEGEPLIPSVRTDLFRTACPVPQPAQKAVSGAAGEVCEEIEDCGDYSTLDGLIPPAEHPDSTPSVSPADWPLYVGTLDRIEVPVAPAWLMPEARPDV